MKRNPITELRWMFAETLLGWAISVAPDDDERIELMRALLPWMKRHLEKLRHS